MAKTINKSTLVIEGQNKSAIAAIDGVSRKLGNAERSMKGFNSGIGGVMSGMSSMFTSLPFMAASAATGVIAGFGAMIKSSIDTAEHIQKMSQRVGVTAESLSTLSYAAQLSGTDIAVFEKAIQRLSRNVDDASRGIGDGKVAFEDLGISVVNTDGSLKDAEVVMKSVADRFVQMEDGTKKTALALKIFGRAGADLIPMLNSGAAGLDAMQTEARNLGIEISGETAEAAAEFKDNMLRLETAVRGLATEAMPSVISELNSLLVLVQNPSWENFWKYFTFQDLELEKLNDATFLTEKMLNNIVKYGSESSKTFGQTSDDAENARRDAEKLAAAWDKVKSSLESDIAAATLSKSEFELYKINAQVDDLNSKFGNKAFITEWAETMKVALLDVNNIDVTLTPAFEKTDTAGLLNPVEYDTSFYDFQKQQMLEVTDLELAQLALRQQGTTEMFMNMTDAAYTFYQSSGQQNKAAFAMYKAFAIAETSISTYQAAMDAYKSMVGIPIVGPGLAVAAAAAATAFGLSQIQAISSMSPGGRANGSASASVPTIPQNNNSITNNESNQTINITINSSYQDKDSLARDLVPAIKKAVKDGVG